MRRYGLSQILNSESMLDTGSNTIPLDFLINGTFLRTTLDEYLAANGLSTETTLILQYVPASKPPQFRISFEHDDWVSSVDVLSSSSPAGRWTKSGVPLGRERILTGSYDGLLRVFNTSGNLITTSKEASAGGHTDGIKSAKFLSNNQIASSGLDRTVRLWKYTESEDGFSGDFKPTLELYGHRGAVDNIAVNTQSNRILTASTDGTVGIWSALKSEGPAAPASLTSIGPSAKRRKLTNSAFTPQRGALSLVAAHSGPVSDVIFDPQDSTVAYSVSLDHTLKTIDLETSTILDTRTTSHPLLSISALPGISGNQLLAAGTSARHITLIDPRVSSTQTSVMTLRGHNNKVVSISPNPTSSYGLVSGSHDGTCRIWDLRATRHGTKDEGGGVVAEPVFVIERQSRIGERKAVAGDGVKVFGVVWNQQVGIVSVGEDKMLQINRGQGVTGTAN